MKRIQISMPTSFSDLNFMTVPLRVRLASAIRRIFNLRAGETTKAGLHLTLTFLGQDGLKFGSDDPALHKNICDLTEREAVRLIRLGRESMRAAVEQFNNFAPRSIAG